MSGVLSHEVCADLLQRPEESNTIPGKCSGMKGCAQGMSWRLPSPLGSEGSRGRQRGSFTAVEAQMTLYGPAELPQEGVRDPGS